MKIALISPRRGELFNNKRLRDVFWASNELKARAEGIYKWPELGLLTLAGLMPREWSIRYIDDYIEEIKYEEEFDLVCITAITPKATRAYQIADNFRKNGKIVVMGGPHASVEPEDALVHVDTVVIGEAQSVWDEFFNDLKKKKIKRIYGSTGILTDMSKSPIPRYDLLSMDNYKVVPIETTRGCPHDCEFCSSTRLWGNKFRQKRIAQVLEEINVLKSISSDKYLFFVDDNMFVNKSYSRELLCEMSKIKNLRWFTQTDISIAEDEAFLELLFNAGCREVLIGFETISKEDLKTVDKNMWKYKRINKYPSAIEKIQNKGISIYGSFILGLDNHTRNTFDNLRHFIHETEIIGYQILVLTPIPGTRIRERFKREKRIIDGLKWENYSTYQLNYILKSMDNKEFEECMVELFKDVYSNEYFLKRKMHYLKILKNMNSMKKNKYTEIV